MTARTTTPAKDAAAKAEVAALPTPATVSPIKEAKKASTKKEPTATCIGACGEVLLLTKFPTTSPGKPRGPECRKCRDARKLANKDLIAKGKEPVPALRAAVTAPPGATANLKATA